VAEHITSIYQGLSYKVKKNKDVCAQFRGNVGQMTFPSVPVPMGTREQDLERHMALDTLPGMRGVSEDVNVVWLCV
jgi:hypothetical protein